MTQLANVEQMLATLAESNRGIAQAASNVASERQNQTQVDLQQMSQAGQNHRAEIAQDTAVEVQGMRNQGFRELGERERAMQTERLAHQEKQAEIDRQLTKEFNEQQLQVATLKKQSILDGLNESRKTRQLAQEAQLRFHETGSKIGVLTTQLDKVLQGQSIAMADLEDHLTEINNLNQRAEQVGYESATAAFNRLLDDIQIDAPAFAEAMVAKHGGNLISYSAGGAGLGVALFQEVGQWIAGGLGIDTSAAGGNLINVPAEFQSAQAVVSGLTDKMIEQSAGRFKGSSEQARAALHDFFTAGLGMAAAIRGAGGGESNGKLEKKYEEAALALEKHFTAPEIRGMLGALETQADAQADAVKPDASNREVNEMKRNTFRTIATLGDVHDYVASRPNARIQSVPLGQDIAQPSRELVAALTMSADTPEQAYRILKEKMNLDPNQVEAILQRWASNRYATTDPNAIEQQIQDLREQRIAEASFGTRLSQSADEAANIASLESLVGGLQGINAEE